MSEPVVLENPELRVVIDPGRGSDVLSVIDKRTGIDIMFSTPWRGRADSVRAGVNRATATTSKELWLEQYRGGWQILCPNAGEPRSAHGALLGYHGEASTAAWSVIRQTLTSVNLHTELVSLPLAIERVISIAENAVTIEDRVSNLSGVPLTFDLVQHPAFGGKFLDGECEIRTGARTFVNDLQAGIDEVAPGSSHSWPNVLREDGSHIDLSAVPGNDANRSAFGWLTDFDGYWATVANPKHDLTVRLDWDGSNLPHAWFWQELTATRGWPWFQRARVLAIEPSSTQTSGPERASAVTLKGNGEISVAVTLAISRYR